MKLSWCIHLALTLISTPHLLSGLASENEVPLRPTTWMQNGKITTVNLTKGRTHRLYFTLQKKTLAVTVSPCSVTIEWSLRVRARKEKTPGNSHWNSKKSFPEVWWKGPAMEEIIHTYTGNAVDTYTGPAYEPSSMYIVHLRSAEQNTRVTVYLHEGPGPSGAFPELPTNSKVHMLGVGMTSVTLSWAPSPSVIKTSHHNKKVPYEYCVLVNNNHNYRNLCAARERIKKEIEIKKKIEKKDKEGRDSVLQILKAWWWQQGDTNNEHSSSPVSRSASFKDLGCICRDTESVCTISDLHPNTQYYFDVFLMDNINGTSVAYTGTLAHTHEGAQQAVTPLREGQVQWVTLRTDSADVCRFRFRPRGGYQNGLLTLQCCNATDKVKVSVFSRGRLLSSREVSTQLAQIWLEGSSTYLIWLQALEGTSTPRLDVETSGICLKLQVSSAHHRRTPPIFPPTLDLKSFNKLRSCSSVTLAWMGTEERSLYCLYHRRIADWNKQNNTDHCLGPESRPATEQVLCKYFQELDLRRAVMTAVIRGLDPGVLYVFDVYLMRRWGLPIKYHSKKVRTRKEC